jgi:hypothetical protein
MPFPRWPGNNRSRLQQLGRTYDRLAFDRALLLWLHLALGFAAAFMYFSTLDFSHFSWWGRVSLYLISHSALAWIPYLISGVYSRRRLPATQPGFWLFVLVLLAGTAAVGYFYLTPMIHDLPVFGVALVQTTAYIAAASVLLGPEMDD